MTYKASQVTIDETRKSITTLTNKLINNKQRCRVGKNWKKKFTILSFTKFRRFDVRKKERSRSVRDECRTNYN